MVSTPRDQIANLREHIETDNDIGDDDRELLIEFSDRLDLLAQQYSDHWHEKLLRYCTIMAEELEDDLSRASLRAVTLLNRSSPGSTHSDNEETNLDYRSSLRVFAKRVADTDDDEYPLSVDWVHSSTSNNYDPTLNLRKMLKWKSTSCR